MKFIVLRFKLQSNWDFIIRSWNAFLKPHCNTKVLFTVISFTQYMMSDYHKKQKTSPKVYQKQNGREDIAFCIKSIIFNLCLLLITCIDGCHTWAEPRWHRFLNWQQDRQEKSTHNGQHMGHTGLQSIPKISGHLNTTTKSLIASTAILSQKTNLNIIKKIGVPGWLSQ